MDLNSRIYISGHRGLVGSAILRHFRKEGFQRIIVATRDDCDLTSRSGVFRLFDETRPEYVIIAAAKVGGIAANIAAPVEFLLENLKIQNNVLEACLEFGAAKTVLLGSSCIYPRECPQPMREEHFMTGPLEPTNESYAVAKIAGIRLAQALHRQHGLNIICPMPCNVYGPGDHFQYERSHVLSALVRRFTEAKFQKAEQVTVWGSGKARREFLHCDDLADAVFFLLKNYNAPDIINVGTGEDFTIQELAETIAHLVDYKGEIQWDLSKPDGMPRKLLDVSRLNALGWKYKIGLESGVLTVVEDFRNRCAEGN